MLWLGSSKTFNKALTELIFKLDWSNSNENPTLDMLLDIESKFFEESLLYEKTRKNIEITVK